MKFGFELLTAIQDIQWPNPFDLEMEMFTSRANIGPFYVANPITNQNLQPTCTDFYFTSTFLYFAFH